MATHSTYIAVSAFDIMAITAVVGALSCRLWILPEATVESLHPRLWRHLAGGLIGLTLSSLVLLIGRTLEMSRQGLSQVGHWLPLVLHETPFGHTWLWRPLMIVLLWAVWVVGRRPRRGKAAAALMFLLVAVIAFTRSATGHPADFGPWGFAEWVDWVHLLATAVWAGSVLIMTITIFPALPDPRIKANARALLISQLSSVATLALIAIVITGVWSAHRYVAHWHNLWYSSYGHILLIKIAFVLAALSLGAINRFFYVPQIRRESQNPLQVVRPTSAVKNGLQLLTRSVAIETWLLFGALAMAAVLLHAMPPRMDNKMKNMTSASATTRDRGPRLRKVIFANGLTHKKWATISTVRYGVLDFTRRSPYSTGPFKHIESAVSI